MIKRDYYLEYIKDSFDVFPICAILGPRQCGKTTLAHSYIKQLNENRPLSKLAYGRKFEGDTEHRTAAYIDVRENSSTGSTYKLPAEVEFRKRSNIKSYFFDLEDPTHLDQLKNPKAALDSLDGLIVIDEIQRRPELFPYLRVLADYSAPSS